MILAAAALVACGDGTGPTGLLVGTWTTGVEDIGAGYSRQETLVFSANGTLLDHIQTWRGGRLESIVDEEYNYIVRNDSLFTMQPRATGPMLYNFVGTRFNGRFEVTARMLTITYHWFGPADEPVIVTQVFLRQRCMLVLSGCM